MTNRHAQAIIACIAVALFLSASPARGQFNPGHDCNFCHSMHSPAPAGNYLLNNAVVETMCQVCHGAGGVSTLKAEVHTNTAGSSYPAFTMTCMDCHNPHSNQPNAETGTTGLNNLKMIGNDALDASGISKINTPNSGLKEVVFESRGPTFSMPSLHSFADTDEDNDGDLDGVCEVCHTAPGNNHTNSNFVPHHSTGISCVDCHAHDDFFHGDGDCLTCHVDPQGPRRPIVPEFSRTSHHVSVAVTVEDCEVCHDASQHDPSDRVRLNDLSGGPVIELTGDPSTDSAEAAKLTDFCLGCHGQATPAPFSDGVSTPPLIDPTLWSAGSHAGGAVSCFGDGQFGCHNTGHGSNKVKLLAPGDHVADADPDDPFVEEERFCFQCHNASGPSAFDLETPFSEPVNWVPEPAGRDDNEDLNDRHDIQFTVQNRSGALLECVDCHDPHVASSARPWIQDPDPTDGHVPGTDWYIAGYQTAGDENSEFCLDCHDGSFPPGVQGHTAAPAGVDDPNVPLVNIQSVWIQNGNSGDTMGQKAASSLDIDTVATGWGVDFVLACSECHRPHPVYDPDVATTNLFMLRDRTHAADGVTELQGMINRAGDFTTNFEYGVETTVSSDPQRDPGTWCMTCHNRTGMITKGNDCTNCHNHGGTF